MGVLIILAFVTFGLMWAKRSGIFEEIHEVERLRVNKDRERRGLPALEKGVKEKGLLEFKKPTIERKPLPKRTQGAPLVHRESMLKAAPWCFAGVVFLVSIGFAAQSLIPVTLMSVPLVLALVFFLRAKERQLRTVDQELSSLGNDWYVPEDWTDPV